MRRKPWRAAPVLALSCALFAALLAGGVAAAQAGPERARNIVLCHEDPPPCEVSTQTNGGGDEHLVTAVVTDASGAPVAGVPVELREEGVGRFTTGGDSQIVSTDADGEAPAVVTADEPGTSRITAEISPYGTPGGFRGAGASDDECEQPAAAGGTPGPGNCIAGPLQADWTVPPPVTDVRVQRAVTIDFAHSDRGRLVLFGRVRATTAGPGACIAAVPVSIYRRSGGEWGLVETVTTSGEGWYVAALADRPGRYRATAVIHEPGVYDGADTTCESARRSDRHRHDG